MTAVGQPSLTHYTPTMSLAVEQRARLHWALADPNRLAIVDELAQSDRSPSHLADRLGIASNLLAHHLRILLEVGLVERVVSSGDRRRRYLRLAPDPLAGLMLTTTRPAGLTLFVCTHNSARSQLAAALWTERTGLPARSAGTHPAERVHPGAVAAAARAGLDLTGATPTELDDHLVRTADRVITVCDQANEELAGTQWWHWSTPDPSVDGGDEAFDAVVAQLDRRIQALA